MNWMSRDAAFGRWVSETAKALGLRTMIVDGKRSIEENVEYLEKYYALSRK